MNADLLNQLLFNAFVGAQMFVQQGNGLEQGNLGMNGVLAAQPASAFNYMAAIAAMYQMPPPAPVEVAPEPNDGYEFDEDVAIEVDLDVDFDENLNISFTRYLDPSEGGDDEEVDIEGITPDKQEVSESQLSTAIAYYDPHRTYVTPEVPVYGETMPWPTAEEFHGPAPVQPMEMQPAPGVPVPEVENPEGSEEKLPKMDVDDVASMDGLAGKTRAPRKHRVRHNPMEKSEETGGIGRRSARRKLQF